MILEIINKWLAISSQTVWHTNLKVIDRENVFKHKLIIRYQISFICDFEYFFSQTEFFIYRIFNLNKSN